MNLERIGNAQGYVESPREKAACAAALARLVASAVIWNLDDSPENIARIVAHDVAVNWPRIEAERGGK